MKYIDQRKYMIENHLKKRDITDNRVLNIMQEIPREIFIPDNLKEYAYDDNPLPIGENQTISQPYMVALMTQLLELTGNENVLEIGTGSGYQTAILAKLSDKVYTIERIKNLADTAKKNLNKLNISNVEFLNSDGTLGWEKYAPYNRIIVTAGAPDIHEPLVNQLDNNGIMVIPVGSENFQILKILYKINNKIKIKNSIACTFVHLKGEFGW